MEKKIGIWINQSIRMGAELQEQKATIYATQKGWAIAEIYRYSYPEKLGISAFEHPEMERMLDDIKEGRITGLIIESLSTLAIENQEIATVIKLFERYNADITAIREQLDTTVSAKDAVVLKILSLLQGGPEEHRKNIN